METWQSEFLEAQSAVFKLLLLSNQQSETQRLYLLSEMTKEETNAHIDEAATSRNDFSRWQEKSAEGCSLSSVGFLNIVFIFLHPCPQRVFVFVCFSKFKGHISGLAHPSTDAASGLFESIHQQLFCCAHIELQVIAVAPCDQKSGRYLRPSRIQPHFFWLSVC